MTFDLGTMLSGLAFAMGGFCFYLTARLEVRLEKSLSLSIQQLLDQAKSSLQVAAGQAELSAIAAVRHAADSQAELAKSDIARAQQDAVRQAKTQILQASTEGVAAVRKLNATSPRKVCEYCDPPRVVAHFAELGDGSVMCSDCKARGVMAYEE